MFNSTGGNLDLNELEWSSSNSSRWQPPIEIIAKVKSNSLLSEARLPLESLHHPCSPTTEVVPTPTAPNLSECDQPRPFWTLQTHTTNTDIGDWKSLRGSGSASQYEKGMNAIRIGLNKPLSREVLGALPCKKTSRGSLVSKLLAPSPLS